MRTLINPSINYYLSSFFLEATMPIPATAKMERSALVARMLPPHPPFLAGCCSLEESLGVTGSDSLVSPGSLSEVSTG